jgi:hypothetical protein
LCRFLFHAGFAPFSGGFVGVDVFFVISGYLIASFSWAKSMREIADKYHAGLIWPHQFLCDEQFCEVQKDGRPFMSMKGISLAQQRYRCQRCLIRFSPRLANLIGRLAP